jgi:hypothetical protein
MVDLQQQGVVFACLEWKPGIEASVTFAELVTGTKGAGSSVKDEAAVGKKKHVDVGEMAKGKDAARVACIACVETGPQPVETGGVPLPTRRKWCESLGITIKCIGRKETGGILENIETRGDGWVLTRGRGWAEWPSCNGEETKKKGYRQQK